MFLTRLLDRTGGSLPANFVVTLPKITVAQQPATLVRLFELLERRHGLAHGALKLEIMIEVTQALLGPSGQSPLPGFLEACEGRCIGALSVLRRERGPFSEKVVSLLQTFAEQAVIAIENSRLFTETAVPARTALM